MADPHLVLAPIVEPPLPPLPVTEPASVTLPLMGALLGLGLIALALWWWRRAPQRALRRIARLGEPVPAAHQLAQVQARYRLQATPHWRAALDRLRFGPPEEGTHDTLRRLCEEAAAFARPRR